MASPTEIKKLGKDYYRFHKKDAANRGIPFLLSYGEWRQVWLDSGHAHEKGCRRGQYVMARFGDKGPYATNNVRIATTEENHAEQWARPEYSSKMSATHKNKHVGEATRQKIRVARKDSKASEKTKAKMSVSQKGNKNAAGNQGWLGRHHKEETKQILRAHNLGKKASAETCAKQSEGLKGNQNALGHKHTPEVCALMSEKGKARWAAIRAAKNSMLQEIHL